MENSTSGNSWVSGISGTQAPDVREFRFAWFRNFFNPSCRIPAVSDAPSRLRHLSLFPFSRSPGATVFRNLEVGESEIGGDSRLARVGDFVFSRILFRPVASHRPPVPFLCLADRCGGAIFATPVRVVSCETRARVNAVPRNSALYHAPTRCLVASLSPYPARLRPTG